MEDIEVVVQGAKVSIPYRISSPSLADVASKLFSLETQLLSHCRFTRHHDGLVRGKYLKKIIGAQSPQVTPYIFQLCGEYVEEIIQIVYDGKDQLNKLYFQDFYPFKPSLLQKIAKPHGQLLGLLLPL